MQLSYQAVDRFATDKPSGRPVQFERQFASKRSTGSQRMSQVVDRFVQNSSSWQIIFSEFLEPIDYDLNL